MRCPDWTLIGKGKNRRRKMLCNNCGKESAGCWSKCPNCGAEKLPNSEEEEDGVKRQKSIQSYCEWKWLEECDVPKEEMEGNIFW